jgi:hypothetical protein
MCQESLDSTPRLGVRHLSEVVRYLRFYGYVHRDNKTGLACRAPAQVVDLLCSRG